MALANSIKGVWARPSSKGSSWREPKHHPSMHALSFPFQSYGSGIQPSHVYIIFP
uniref:Uncharacterized protein n=1 Tax=Arundo donax TaxID=35708 RepID=A0A0A9HCR1_ARUDO